MVLKLEFTLVLLNPTILAVLVSMAVNCIKPRLLTVFREAAPPSQFPLDRTFIRLLPEPKIFTLARSEALHFTCSSAVLQAEDAVGLEIKISTLF